MTKPTIDDDIAALSAAIDAETTLVYIGQEMRDSIARLIAALQEAREDSGRLNWFSDHVVSVVDDCRMLKTWHVESSVGYFRGETIRSAIDAARNIPAAQEWK